RSRPGRPRVGCGPRARSSWPGPATCWRRPPRRFEPASKLDEPTASWKEALMELTAVPIDKPEDLNFVLGQSHFIKTVEDLYEALAGSSPHLKFGIAFCESSGPRLVRRAGNDDELVELATRNALAIGAGHAFIVFLREGFPVNVLNQIKMVPEVCRIYCATANPAEVLVAETD